MEKSIDSFPLVSVIVPVYNGSLYLGKTIPILLNQSYDNIEFIIVNDGSTDDSLELLKKFDDSRISIYCKKNGGLSDARNFGLQYAKGDYVTFVDSDDFVTEKLIERLVMPLVNSKTKSASAVGFVTVNDYSKWSNWHPNKIGKLTKVNVREALLVFLNRKGPFDVSAWAKMYPIDCFNDVKFSKGIYYEDLEILPKLMKSDMLENVYIDTTVCYGYVFRNGSIMNSNLTKEDLTLLETVDLGIQLLEDDRQLCESYKFKALAALMGVLRKTIISRNREYQDVVLQKMKMIADDSDLFSTNSIKMFVIAILLKKMSIC